jgi:pimeloyl-ACP methyl ester carboxylesterase
MIEHTFQGAATTLNYAAEGRADGSPLLFLHGVTGRWQTWLPVLAAFWADWQVYALDHRGHGRSGHVRERYRIVDYAADTIEFLRRQVARPAVLVGHSLGAMITIAVAAEAPKLVRAAVLEDPPLGAFSDQRMRERPEYEPFLETRDLARAGLPRERLFATLAEQQPEVDAATLGARTLALSQMDPDVLTLILDERAREGYDPLACLARISCPVLLQQGDVALGAALEDERVARSRALLARCTFERFAEVGHGIHGEQPFAFCRSVRDFLAAL